MKEKIKSDYWNGFAASVPGSGHIRYGIPCQDASAVFLGDFPAVIVCDGRGSAKLSHFGAQEAITAFKRQIAVLTPFLANILDNPQATEESWDKFCKIIFRTLMQVKLDLSDKHNCLEKEFDFTVVLAIAGKEKVGCFQVGDGSLVLWKTDRAECVFQPDKGEFANQTHFLREGGEDRGEYHAKLFFAEKITGISATSDGPEHLMFQLPDMTPGKIFNLLFCDLCDNNLSRQDLMDFLTRKDWNNDPRGTDDRSIAIIAKTRQETIENDPQDMPPEFENEGEYDSGISLETSRQAITLNTTATAPEKNPQTANSPNSIGIFLLCMTALAATALLYCSWEVCHMYQNIDHHVKNLELALLHYQIQIHDVDKRLNDYGKQLENLTFSKQGAEKISTVKVKTLPEAGAIPASSTK